MKLKTLALATSLALSAASMAGAARADALSTAVLDITNFEIQQGGTALDYNNGTPGDFTFWSRVIPLTFPPG
jgi:polyisoprenoid-binding protein YceI